MGQWIELRWNKIGKWTGFSRGHAWMIIVFSAHAIMIEHGVKGGVWVCEVCDLGAVSMYQNVIDDVI